MYMSYTIITLGCIQLFNIQLVHVRRFKKDELIQHKNLRIYNTKMGRSTVLWAKLRITKLIVDVTDILILYKLRPILYLSAYT